MECEGGVYLVPVSWDEHGARIDVAFQCALPDASIRDYDWGTA